VKQFRSGAKSSEQKPRFDLVEVEALTLIANRMEEAIPSHGERNYRKGAGDPDFLQDRKNHLVEHALKYAQGDTSDNHLAALLANGNMCAWLEAHSRDAMSFDEKREHLISCHCGRQVTKLCGNGSRCAMQHFPTNQGDGATS
jgi:hypothetical protein